MKTLAKFLGVFVLALITCYATDVVAFDAAPVAAVMTASPLAILRIGKQSVEITEDTGSIDRYYAQLEAHVTEQVEAAVEAAVKPVQSELTAAQEEIKALRELTVGEIVRRRALVDKELKTEDETAYLMGLPPDRLAMEWKRMPKAESLEHADATSQANGGDQEKNEFAPE